MIQYWCEDGWTLVPPEFESATCMLGNWSKPQPQCVRPGCDDLRPPEDGELSYSLDRALVTFQCNTDLVLIGEPVLGCDGQYWNASVPECVVPVTAGVSKLITSGEISIVLQIIFAVLVSVIEFR